MEAKAVEMAGGSCVRCCRSLRSPGPGGLAGDPVRESQVADARYAARGEIFQNRHGAFNHDDMIGRPFGSKMISRKKNAHSNMTSLALTPQLWICALRHSTQTVFTFDASAVMFAAVLRAGSRVVESGTGSGALTTSFVRVVVPHSHVFTFEFNVTRV
jgi:tRNA (adenine57-N1/adenine58-N1)-methyltransferase